MVPGDTVPADPVTYGSLHRNGEAEPKEGAMSTRVGTLQGSGAGRSIWPAAIVGALVMLTIAVTAVSLIRDQGSQTAERDVVQNAPSVVGGTAANTPSELSGGIVGGTAATTAKTAAGSSSIAVGVTPDMHAAIVAARDAAEAQSELSGGTTGNTPSELTGGMFDRYGQHQRI
jgi:hypothetical protein